MKKVEYSQIVRQKIKNLRAELTRKFSEEIAKKSIKKIVAMVEKLGIYEKMGVSISKMYAIDCDYRYIYVAHNYLFYRIEPKRIIIVEMFDEREDFMQKLFGLTTTLQNTLDDWEE